VNTHQWELANGVCWRIVLNILLTNWRGHTISDNKFHHPETEESQTYVYISRRVWFAAEWRPNVNCSRAILAKTSIWLSLWTKREREREREKEKEKEKEKEREKERERKKEKERNGVSFTRDVNSVMNVQCHSEKILYFSCWDP
jgi:flagellar biosynthesis component FlhA